MSLDQIYAIESFLFNMAEKFLGINSAEPILVHSNYASKTHNAIYYRGSMTVELPYDHPIVKKDFYMSLTTTRWFELIITEHHEVFVRWDKEFPKSENKIIVSEFENTGNHNSCWKSSNRSKMITNFFEICDEVNAKAKRIKKGNRQVAPAKMQLRIDFGGFAGCNPVQFAKVAVKYKDNDHYFLDLISVDIKKTEMKYV
jgi:hypothetical protein